LSLLAGLLLIATALLAALPGLLLSRLAWLLSATALLAGFVVRVHNCSLFSLSIQLSSPRNVPFGRKQMELKRPRQVPVLLITSTWPPRWKKLESNGNSKRDQGDRGTEQTMPSLSPRSSY
jgi:hypothetical protein